MDRSSTVFVAGGRGLAGSAIQRRLRAEKFRNLIAPTSAELDLRDPAAVDAWFERHRPQYVFLVAGTVGGIMPNWTRPADFLLNNLLIHSTVIPAAHRHGARKLLYLGSSCIYPRNCPQPMKEESLLTGPLEPTNEAYALAKISGIKLCQAFRKQHGCNFISGMPTNLYGPWDNFDPVDSHVLPALLRRFHEAKGEVTVWGTGSPRREFLHADDLGDACVFLMRHYDGEEHVNIGTGVDLSIAELADTIRRIVAPKVQIKFDAAKPDGMPRKVLDVGRLTKLGWTAKISLDAGIRSTYDWFRENYGEAIKPRSERAVLA